MSQAACPARKTACIVPVLLLLSLLLTGCPGKRAAQFDEPAVSGKRNGVAVLLTGAAARIPQEAALLEELDRRGLLNDLVFLSGVSSGALNSVMFNGIRSGRMSWEEYRNILFSLKDSDIYLRQGKKLPVNTAPARKLYQRVVKERLGYRAIGDLPLVTAISITHLQDLDLKRTVYRMCSRKINEESDPSLNLVDVLMASSSFPVVFPPVTIGNPSTIPDVEYVDGGVGIDHVPSRALLEFEKYRGAGVERVYIISRKSDSLPEVSEELRGLGIDDKGIFDRLGISLDAILYRGLVTRLEAYAAEAPELVPRTWVWIPDFQEDFLLFNFENLREQYELTYRWAGTNNPVPLEDFLIRCRKKQDLSDTTAP